ncbi:type I restriction endonuclease subunit R [Anatilimnocola floriformis]|uniref:type I restriction endonuclease subunit R n=1 Tax=Anatilimnocola floriformis TaxID=2948575 RepID=UPI0020C33E66|nr:type I restriction endonuclease subunit R [Anatilimnocola floriformis]
MSTVGEREAKTHKRVVNFFLEALKYDYLGYWKDRDGNCNVEEGRLSDWLKRQGHTEKVIAKVLHEISKAKTLAGSKTLYDANREMHSLLRYGVKVKPDVGEQNVTVWLVDWKTTRNNDFGVAEEVTIAGEHSKRPDVVLYVNGIALGVLELKRSIVSVTEGIRQNLDSQKREFIRPFYATVQLVLAGNETEGLRYGVTETPEKYYLRWREDVAHPGAGDNPLLRELGQVCSKDRLLEIVHDFIVFDAGTKKTCRHNQYFGIREAQDHVRRREGGIIWHTQGSGKSLTMVWLAKWIREHVADARVLLITDRTELDEQIEKVFKGVSESIYRTKSGSDLVRVLNASEEWLICSLIHKFGAGEELSDKDIEAYVEDIKKSLPKGFHAKGDVFVFVDECHRTQSGKLHEAMKTLLPGAMLIGFTGTPLLKKDKQKSIEVFGPYIHTYKYHEAVRDGVVLDLRYEARDIDQNITSQAKIDQWFEIKTRGLSDLAKAQLKQRWGTMQKVLSSQDRLEKIVADILLDMETRDRLKSGYGNALLVSGSIYSACRFFEMFQNKGLGGKCAIVTSYKPSPADIKGEETGEGLTERLRQYDIYRKMLAAHFNEPEDAAMHKVETFEQEVKKRFIDEPGQMKLLIVVDKLLTGFDAPPATYLYIDKKMHDHGLFQAICRVNRLDGEDKEYGYVVDYKDLFKSLEKSIKDYTGEAFENYDADDVAGLLKDRLEKGKERLAELLESIRALCEPVEPPRDTAAYVRFFCAMASGDAEQLKDNEPKRVALYKLVAALVRAYANLANEMAEAGYSEAQAREIKDEVGHYEKVREEVKLASGDYIDMKMYEPAMRHLLDTYIRAEESEKVSAFDDMSLVELIVERGEAALDALPEGIRKNPEAMAETIENNVRRLIIDEMAVNPKYYEKMSELLDALILQRKKEALDYKVYLAKVVDLTKQVKRPVRSTYPGTINSAARQALFDNLGRNEQLAIQVDTAIRSVKKDDWRGMRAKRIEVRNAIKAVLGDDDGVVDAIYKIAESQRDY